MSVGDAFDEWADDGRDREMEDEHWATAKQLLARMPVEPGDRVLDLGTGSGYAPRAISQAADAGLAVGLDASPEMVTNARSYTDDSDVGFLAGDFHQLPFESESFDHCVSMESFFFATHPEELLAELRRVLRSGGTFYCGVNYYQENHYAHEWADRIEPEMLLWSATEYRSAFQNAGFQLAEQSYVPDRDTEIPPESEFPTAEFETREQMVERYRELGTLLTVAVVP
ncbi:class I SAM-dependent methyltransferase [Halovenus rubra]|uniref:Class I SAM-dependent methyltransferase n=2 Tax=Halovenus rubra TaxID=869890 RepID=A0ABD5X0L3_9EURY|nr:methyltransferase domain-containing protein [Halovenus rubra]